MAYRLQQATTCYLTISCQSDQAQTSHVQSTAQDRDVSPQKQFGINQLISTKLCLNLCQSMYPRQSSRISKHLQVVQSLNFHCSTSANTQSPSQYHTQVPQRCYLILFLQVVVFL